MYVEQIPRISLNWIKKYLKYPGCEFNFPYEWTIDGEPAGNITIIANTRDEYRKFLLLNYHMVSNPDLKYDYKVYIHETECNYGGVRYWLICPNSNCGKVCCKLYFKYNYFLCRKCTRYLYRSQTLSHNDRMISNSHKLDKAEELEQKLKKKFYQGKATKKFRQIEKMKEHAEMYESMCNWKMVEYVSRYDPELKRLVNKSKSLKDTLRDIF